MTALVSSLRRAAPVVPVILLATALSAAASGLVLERGRDAAATSNSNPVSAATTEAPVGCGPGSAPPADDDFVPIENRLGAPVYPPIEAFGSRVDSFAEVGGEIRALEPGFLPDDLRHRAIFSDTGGTGWAAVMYASPKAVAGTYVDVMAAGGVMIAQQKTRGQDAAQVLATLDEAGQQSSLIDIGPHQAVIHHGDPVGTNDVRPWLIYWSDGMRDWEVAGAGDPATLIDIARSIHCG